MDLLDISIERLREASAMSLRLYEKPLLLTYSGGKDSDTILELGLIAKIPFEVCHNLTTADAPETVHYVKRRFYGLECQSIKCEIIKPYYAGERTSLWSLIPRKGIPPTRIKRYCCKVLKEGTGRGRFIVTGVRWDESVSRNANRGVIEVIARDRDSSLILRDDNDQNRRIFESCSVRGQRASNPIVDWLSRDVWGFLRERKCKSNPLYGRGWCRVGCVGCPMADKQRYFEFAQYPVFQQNYIRAFDRMIEARRQRGKLSGNWRMGTTGQEVFHWWMEDGVLPGQYAMEGYEDNWQLEEPRPDYESIAPA